MMKDTDPRYLRRLKQAVLSLPCREREIFVACCVHGLANEDAALRFGISIREVEQLLARALTNLERQMR